MTYISRNLTAQAINDLQTSLQQTVSQLRILQQTVSSDRAEIKRLSDDVTALTGKLEVLQQSFASDQQVPAVQPTDSPLCLEQLVASRSMRFRITWGRIGRDVAGSLSRTAKGISAGTS